MSKRNQQQNTFFPQTPADYDRWTGDHFKEYVQAVLSEEYPELELELEIDPEKYLG